MTRLTRVSTYFVLNSLLNGERGVTAVPAGSGLDRPQADGFYYLLEDESDGHGPFDSRDDALEAGERAADTQCWVFPSDELPRPVIITAAWDGDGDVATIVRTNDGDYECELQGSYETLKITVSAKDFAHAARVFHAALGMMEE